MRIAALSVGAWIAALMPGGPAGARPPAPGATAAPPAVGSGTHAGEAAREAHPWQSVAYLGVELVDLPGGRVGIARVRPGPLNPDGTELVKAGEVVTGLDGKPVTDAAAFNEALAGRRPGEAIVLTLRGDGGDERALYVTLGDRYTWSGTLGWGGGTIVPEAELGEFEVFLTELAQEAGILDAPGGVRAAAINLIGVQNNAIDPYGAPLTARALRRALSSDWVERELTRRVRAVEAAAGGETNVPAAGTSGRCYRALTTLVCEVLGVAEPRNAVMDWPLRMTYMAGNGAALRRGADDLRPALVELAERLATRPGLDAAHARHDLATLRAAAELSTDAFRDDLMRLRAIVPDLEQRFGGRTDAPPVTEVPAAVRAVVEGDILGYERNGDGSYTIVGGAGPNRYIMTDVVAVYDVGGDDVYVWPERAATQRGRLVGVVVDLAGNDRYEGSRFAGPGVGVLGLNIVDDRGGNDTYVGTGPMSMAAGLLGVGAIIDHGGDDTYESGAAGTWTQGAGLYGAGVLIDLGGDDRYIAAGLAQGVGGPRGTGLLIDHAGADRYRLTVADSQAAGGQGFGWGCEGIAAGGTGGLFDAGGDDRYEAVEHAQGTGLYQGFGVLHDGDGQDVYAARDRAQAFAMEGGIGMLRDERGADRYALDGTGQAAAEAHGVAWLVDEQGDDEYQAGASSQGSARDQSVAVLVDRAGADRYQAAAPAQGLGGGNMRFWTGDNVLSFSALLDLGGPGRGGPGASDAGGGRMSDTFTGAGVPDVPAAPDAMRALVRRLIPRGAFDAARGGASDGYGLLLDQ